MTIYKVGYKLSGAAVDIQYIDADIPIDIRYHVIEDEEKAAMIYDKIYCSNRYCDEFFVKKLGLFRITVHVVRIPMLPSGGEYKILRKSWKPLTWLA
jgi:hypothetical protein